ADPEVDVGARVAGRQHHQPRAEPVAQRLVEHAAHQQRALLEQAAGQLVVDPAPGRCFTHGATVPADVPRPKGALLRADRPAADPLWADPGHPGAPPGQRYVTSCRGRCECSLNDSSRRPVEPSSARVTDALAVTVLKACHSRGTSSGGASTSIRVAATAAIGPPEDTTTVIPSRANARSRASVARARNASQDSTYSSSCSPPHQRAVASSKTRWKARLSLPTSRPARVCATTATWSNSFQPSSSSGVTDQPPPSITAVAVSRCRRIAPCTTAYGVTPWPASARPSIRLCSMPVSLSTS